MKTLIAITEGKKENKITTVENNTLAVWKKLREVFGSVYNVDTYYGRVRVTTTKQDIVDFFENPHNVKRGEFYTEVIL